LYSCDEGRDAKLTRRSHMRPKERLCEQALFVRSAQQLAHHDNLPGYGYIGGTLNN
ncbi:Uncharacterized protein ALO37_05112, partial [Pseudomonas savastanoi pv. glycinea]